MLSCMKHAMQNMIMVNNTQYGVKQAPPIDKIPGHLTVF